MTDLLRNLGSRRTQEIGFRVLGLGFRVWGLILHHAFKPQQGIKRLWGTVGDFSRRDRATFFFMGLCFPPKEDLNPKP